MTSFRYSPLHSSLPQQATFTNRSVYLDCLLQSQMAHAQRLNRELLEEGRGGGQGEGAGGQPTERY